MKKLLVIAMLFGGLLLLPTTAKAHCDSIDGPVATAAIKALDTKNVNLILPFAPAEAEAEITAAFEQALVVRSKGPEAKALADRYFMETAVRLHRAGEKAAYTGLKPAGIDFGPAIPAAEKALELGKAEVVVKFISHAVEHGIAERFEHARHKMEASKEPAAHAGVAAARERVSTELEFIGYVEGIYLATKGGHHEE
ncbi:MAG TPA: DUF6448 family protein [Candidatus Methylomirabilis sp.]|nr:DUF6448 family protein [Candidatus Methylomirabilis sp.]HSC69909.1 DUF6448 family protein [Candidatus Methylomirabilis sp.]